MGYHGAMTDEIYGGRSKQAVGKRLALTREAFGLRQGEFGKRAGIKSNTYNMIEAGQNYPSIANAHALCDAYGLDFNWIFTGDPSGLKYSLGDLLHRTHQFRSQRGAD